MKKVELVEAVAKSAGLTKSAAAKAVDATFEAITTPDSVTKRGAADGVTAPTETDVGDGEFVPGD